MNGFNIHFWRKGGFASMPQDKDHSAKTISFVMVITLVGKVLGLLRDRLLTIHYGSGVVAGAFLTASRIPRVFFDVVFASAISACFIPVFSETLAKHGKKNAFRLANAFITVVAVFSALLSLLGVGLSEPLALLMAGTEGQSAETLALITDLTRIMFPTAFFTALAFSFVGVLQSLGNFYVPALISTVSNLVVIAYYVTCNNAFGIYGLAVAFLVGWSLQAVVQVPSMRRLGYRYRPVWEPRAEAMGKIFHLMPAVMISTWVQPINQTINARFGWQLYDGAGVSAIELSSNLYLIIAGVFVLSVTNVIFPKLSRQTAQADTAAFDNTLRQSLQSTLFLVLPLMAGLMVVSTPLIDFVYGGGEFDAFSVSITARGLFWVSLGMAGYAVQNIASRAYFARQEGKIPLITGAFSIGVNLILCVVLTPRLEIQGLALASAISATVYGLLLLVPLHLRNQSLITPHLLLSLLKMTCSTILMALCAGFVAQCSSGLLPGKTGQLLTLVLTAASGCLVYFALALLLRLDEANAFYQAVARKLKRG